MESTSPENGLEELLRLSKEITKSEQEHTKKEQDHAERRQKAQGVQQGLAEIKVSVAVEQLKLVATPELVEEVSSLRLKRGVGDLRILISNLAANLERLVDSASSSNADMVQIERSVKTLAILIELLFSLE
ncbi:hypothetical protein ACFLW6_01840 [Chloroflexota bacterium]